MGALPNEEFWRGRKVLVTGSTGFKGSWLCFWLLEMGAEVVGYALEPDTHPSIFTALDLESRMVQHYGDVRDREALRNVVQEHRPSVVLHLAAQPLVRLSYREPVETYETNVMGTVHLLDAIRVTEGVAAPIIVTSDKCYENREWHYGYRENEPMGGHDPYSNSKGCAELVTAAYRKSFFSGDDTAVVCSARAGNVIGGGDWAEDRLIPDAARAFTEHRRVEIRNPHAIRPWQHVLEPICGYLVLAEEAVAKTNRSFSYNFGPRDADVLSVGSIINLFAEAWGEGAAWKFTGEENAVYEAKLLKLDSSLAKAELGWAPRWDTARAAQETAHWYRMHAAIKDVVDIELDQHTEVDESAIRSLTRSQIAAFIQQPNV